MMKVDDGNRAWIYGSKIVDYTQNYDNCFEQLQALPRKDYNSQCFRDSH